MKKVISLLLAAVMLIGVLAGCAEEKVPAPNASTAKMEDMVAWLTSEGYIAKDATYVDMNKTKDYLVNNVEDDSVPFDFCDDGRDYNGLYIMWWDTTAEAGTEEENHKNIYDNLKMGVNGNVILIGGGARVMEIAGFNGAFAIDFAEGYEKADEVLEKFMALEAE